jgi:Rrf2 family iron-sulfur cluster assembly transcriptional regulator
VNLTLSKRGDYVVRSALCLARAYPGGAPVKRRQLALEVGVPRTFASQVLGDLIRAGLAASSFGAHGGYRLARDPAQVSLLELLEAGEGPLVPDLCALGGEPCREDAPCPLHEAWSKGVDALRAVLAETRLADLAAAEWPRGSGGSTPGARTVASAVPVADSVQVETGAPEVARRLRSGGGWLVPHLEGALAEGEAVRIRVGPGGPAWLGKTVAVHLGTATGDEEDLAIPLAWEATGRTGLFPRLEGELRLVALDPDRAELRLSGRYRPPLGRAGQVLDEALLARIARATVRSFLRRLARALEEDDPARQARPGAGTPAAPAASTILAGPRRPA